MITSEYVLRAFYAPLSGGRLEIYDTLLTADWIERPAQPDTPAGPDAYKQRVALLRAAVPDLIIEVQDVFANDDRGAVRSILSATHRVPLFGFAPTGRSFRIMTIDIHRLVDKRIPETWHVEDWLDALRQSGSLMAERGIGSESHPRNSG